MSTTAVIAAVVVLVAVLVAVAGAGVFTTSTVETSSAEGPAVEVPSFEPPSDGSYGYVYRTYERQSGFSIFGLNLTSPKFSATVGFVPPAGCQPPDSGRLEPEGACAGALEHGEISGGGTTSAGDTLIFVAVDISKSCFEALTSGERWPTDLPACN